jgi:hypothetical protein
VGVEGGEFAVDVDGDGAVKVDVLVVAGPDVGQRLVVDPPAGGAQLGDGTNTSRQSLKIPRPGAYSPHIRPIFLRYYGDP